MPNTTLLDIAKQNGCSVAPLIEEVQKATPEILYGAGRTIKGVDFKTLVRTAVPVVSFRQYGEGVTPQKSTWENRLFACHVLNPRWEVDVAIADAHEDGAAVAIGNEAKGQMLGSLITLGTQFYYGPTNGGDAAGAPGLIDMYDASGMVVDAGGTTAGTGSSVWAVRWGDEGVQWLWGLNGSLAVGDPKIERVTDANGKVFDAYTQNMLARPGLQLGSKTSVGRIKKMTTDAGKGCTDALLSQLLELFPVGYPPDMFLMTRRSRGQLQRSRTATTATGAMAPLPTEFEGIPIFPTDSILNTEALTL